MTRVSGREHNFAGDAEDFNNRLMANPSFTMDPTLLKIPEHGTDPRLQHPRNVRGSRIGRIDDVYQNSFESIPGEMPGGREDMQRPRLYQNSSRVYEQASTQSRLGYPDVGLMDRGASWHRNRQSDLVPQSKTASTMLESQREVNVPALKGTNNKRTTGSSKKRSSTDAGFSSADDGEESLEAHTGKSKRSTRQYKSTKRSRKVKDSANEEEQERRVRKVSKLSRKIAEGKGPKKGRNGPTGEVRFQEDGSMEFRDADFPEWTLAAYHKDYRRKFLDEAAKAGDFDHTPTRGDAKHDETSYEPSQKSWGPSRSDWQNIIDSQGKKVMFSVDRFENLSPAEEPENWVHDGRVLLDAKNHPVKNWPGLNKTLSSEIESWRWEALMRLYPWLTVADLLARMPHERQKRGKVVPLQTPQAFTNRAYRFRVPNQIPAAKPKNGSGSYKEGILANLARKAADSTEALSVLNPRQIAKVRKKNKGKFLGNSRYVTNGDCAPKTPPVTSKKRKMQSHEDTESETDQAAKRLCTRTPKSLDIQSNYDLNAAQLQDTSRYHEPIDTTQQWNNLVGRDHPTYIPESSENKEYLLPLFASIEDQGLAMVENENGTNPYAVIWARRAGNHQTRQIGIYWYSSNVPRHVGVDGKTVDDVVDSSASQLYEAEEPIPNHDDEEFTSQYQDSYGAMPPLTQSNVSAAIDPLFDAHSGGSSQGFPSQILQGTQTMASSSPQTPLSGQSQMGSYQTQPSHLEAFWRDRYGLWGF